MKTPHLQFNRTRFQNFRNNKKIRFFIMIAMGVIFLILVLTMDQDTIKASIQSNPKQGALISIGLYVLMGLFFIPSEPLTVFLGVIMEPRFVMLITGIGNILASLIEYWLGTTIADFSSFEEKKANLPLHLGDLPADSLIFQFAVRVIPGVGSKMVGVISGIYHVPLLKFILIGVLCNMTGAFFLAYGGKYIAEFITEIKESIDAFHPTYLPGA